MTDIKKMEVMINIILTMGMMISVGLVVIGGTVYLLQHGNDIMHYDLVQTDYSTTFKLIWLSALSLSPFGLIEAGVVMLVLTQAMRIGLLVCFYSWMRDYWYTLISTFILMVLIYSLFFR